MVSAVLAISLKNGMREPTHFEKIINMDLPQWTIVGLMGFALVLVFYAASQVRGHGALSVSQESQGSQETKDAPASLQVPSPTSDPSATVGATDHEDRGVVDPDTKDIRAHKYGRRIQG